MIIFDMSNIFFINLHASMDEVEEKDENGKKIKVKRFNATSCRYMILNTVRAVVSRYKGKYGEVVFACDARMLWRKDFFKPYKSHRKADREAQENIDWKEVFAFFDEFKNEMRTYTKYKLIEIDGAEGDDVIATLAIRYGDQPNLIVSVDKDFKQLMVYTSCTIYNPIENKIVKAENPFQFLHEHIIRGDRGDGVPNVMSNDTVFQELKDRQVRLTEARMDYMLNVPVSEWDELEQLTKHFEKYKIKKEDIRERETNLFILGKDQYINRNKPLIDLREVPEEIQEAIIDKYKEVAVPSMRKKSLFDYFYKYNLTQLMSSINDF